MMSPIDPKTLLIIHQDKQKDLERQIEYLRAAKEMRAYETGRERRAWYAQAAEWLQEKVLRRAPVTANAGPQNTFEDPGQCVPC